MAKKKWTKEESQYVSRCVADGCIICERPAAWHHLLADKGMGLRADHKRGLALCGDHHQHGGYGVAIHAGVKGFEDNFGTELELLEQQTERLERSIF